MDFIVFALVFKYESKNLVHLLLRLDPDKKPPTISLDDSFLWLLDRRYLGRWWASCRDDLGLDDRAVYMPGGLDDKAAHMPEGDIKKKRSSGRGQHRGYARRHGRPPDPITPVEQPELAGVDQERCSEQAGQRSAWPKNAVTW